MLSSFAQFSIPSRQTRALPAISPFRHFDTTSACDISTTSLPVTLTIHTPGAEDGGSELAKGSERWAVLVASDDESQLLSIESELSMRLPAEPARGARIIAPSGRRVDHPSVPRGAKGPV